MICLAHEDQDTLPLQMIGAEIVRGSMLEPERWKEVLKRCDAALNLQDHFDLRGNVLHPDSRIEKTLELVNYDGAMNFMQTCVSVDVPKILTLSSVFAIGDHRGKLADEAFEHRRAFKSYYEKVKYDALFRTKVLIEEGAQIACVLPGPILGPRGEGPFAKVVENYVTGRLPWIVDTRSQMTFTYIDDVVRGIFQILDQRAPVGLYIMANEPLSWTEFFSKLEKVSGVSPREGKVPERFASRTLGPVYFWNRLWRREPVLPPELLPYLVDCQFRFSSAKAQKRLSWDFSTMEVWLAEMVEEIKSAAQGPGTQTPLETFDRSRRPAGY